MPGEVAFRAKECSILGDSGYLRDQPATSAAASIAGHRMHTQRLNWVAMSLMCSPPIRSSATLQKNGHSHSPAVFSSRLLLLQHAQ